MDIFRKYIDFDYIKSVEFCEHVSMITHKRKLYCDEKVSKTLYNHSFELMCKNIISIGI